MTWTAVSRVCLVALLWVLAACDTERHQPANGEPAPAFSLMHLNGTAVHVPSDLRGQVTAIRFWADWCPYCKDEMKDIEPVYRKYRKRGLRVLAVNVMQPAETARAFVDKLGVSYEVLLDINGDVTRRYGVLGLPTTFFIDQDGVIRAKIHGESTAEVFERTVTELLQREPMVLKRQAE